MIKAQSERQTIESSPSRMRACISSPALNSDYDGHNLVFVVGCPRSGTTWLQRLLASHPQIRTGQESHLFQHYIGSQLRNWRVAAEPRFRGGVGMACYFTEEEFLHIVKAYLLTLIEPMVGPLGPGELFLEKSPSNALFLPELFELLPKARVIHLIRDPRDVVSSLISGETWISEWAPRKAAVAGNWWARHIIAVRDARPQLPPGQFREVKYEDLSRSPIEVLRGCADFLNLGWDTSEIANAVDANQASKAKTNGGGSPIPLSGEVAKRSGPIVVEPEGFIRKAKLGAWRDDLSLYEKFRVWRDLHELMEEVGYTWPNPMEFSFSCLSGSVDLARLLLSPGKWRARE